MLSYLRPLIVSGLGTADQACRSLTRVAFGSSARESGYDEAWLQALLHEHPALLPVEAVEPALTPLVPICREMQVPSGFIDNLFLTPDGGIVLVETKLWRNAEARREVVAQVLDYAKDMQGLSYEAFEAAVRRARREDAAFRLFSLVSTEGAEAEEIAFADAVARNLRLGRILLMIVGDGIREGVEELTGFLQRHLGLQVSLSLVQMALWRDEVDGAVFVQPNLLMRTVQIERAVVRVEQGVSLVPTIVEASKPSSSRPTTISSASFNEQLEAVSPGLSADIAAFLDAAAPLGVIAEQKVSLSLKWQAPDGDTFHLGSILPNGSFDSTYANWSADGIGRLDLSHAYQHALAALVSGGRVKETAKAMGWYVVGPDGRAPDVRLLLAQRDGWLAAIATYTAALGAALSTPASA